VAVQETVAVPEPAMLLGVIAPQLSPLGMVSVRDTAPVKPPIAAIVMVEVGDWPTLDGAGEDPWIEKSGIDETETATVARWERVPLVPVTVTV
jgi:hypothetical protein